MDTLQNVIGTTISMALGIHISNKKVLLASEINVLVW